MATKKKTPKKRNAKADENATKGDALTVAKARGGLARAEALTPERRQSIAQRAAAARWGAKPLRATHRGNFEQEFGFNVECYVIDDEQKTAVVSQGGIAAALGLPANRGTNFVRFLNGERMVGHATPELLEKLDNPLIFQSQNATVYGYDVTILIDVCKAVISAGEDGRLAASQLELVRQARVIVGASAKAGIKGLVYALAGYDAARAEVVAAFKVYVREEAREYEREFPDQLYEQWYRLYELPKPGRNKPWKFKQLTLTQVYTPLARSNGKILRLTKEQKAAGDDPHAKLHQFLSEVGVKALRTHLGELLGIAKISETKEQYEQFVERLFGAQQSIDFAKKRA
jgi:hypothetical protein